jgi:hypothetical protein
MQISGHHIEDFFTANSELELTVLSEDGLTLRHNKIKGTQSYNTLGGMPVDDFNKDFVIMIEKQVDVKTKRSLRN